MLAVQQAYIRRRGSNKKQRMEQRGKGQTPDSERAVKEAERLEEREIISKRNGDSMSSERRTGVGV